MRFLSTVIAVAVVIVMFTQRANANLVGSTVTGQLYVDYAGAPYQTNLFDPANNTSLHGVPATGVLNSAGPTVTISQSQVEFGYQDDNNIVTADFGADTLVITEIQTSGRYFPLAFFFYDPAFANTNLSISSYTFSEEPSYGHLGSTLPIHIPYESNGGTFSAAFTLLPVPEPSAMAMGCLSMIGLVRRRR